MNSFRFCFAGLLLAAASVTAAAAAPAKTSPIPFLGEKPGDTAIEKMVANDIRRFPAGERDALLEIILSCELNRATLARRRLYDAWEKRCKKAENVWNAKYRNIDDRRMIDAQMRIYFARRLSLTRSSSGYFAQKEIIARKARRGQDITKDFKDVVRLRKELFGISGRILKFFFALKNLFAESRR